MREDYTLNEGVLEKYLLMDSGDPVIVPNGTKTIGSEFLQPCYDLGDIGLGVSKIVIPDSVETVSPGAFVELEWVSEGFEVDRENPYLRAEGRMLFSKDGTRLIAVLPLDNYQTGKELIIPDGVEIVEECAMYNADYETIVCPQSVKTIKDQWFHPDIWADGLGGQEYVTGVFHNKDTVFPGKIKDLLKYAEIIKAPEGSEAIEYAKEHGIEYEVI